MKKLLLVFLSLTLTFNALADVKARATAPSAVAADDRFQVEYTINDKATEIRVDFKDSGLEVLYGPAAGTSYKNINGVQSMASSFTYTLVARSEGTYTIPAATIISGGENYTTNSFTIKVLPADTSSGTSQSSRQQDRGNQKIDVNDVHLDLSLSKTNVYEGEAIVATLKLYFRNTPIHSISDAKLPEFDGFTVQDMDLGNPEATLERYKGANYQMYPIKQWLLFPSRSGEVKISQAHITAIAQVVTRSSTGGWFDFPMDYATNVDVPISSAARTVKVSPLPAGKPLSYSNGVGEFKMDAEVTTDHVKANDALIYRITIEGTGNLKYINDLQPEFPSDFEVYDPKVDLSARTTSQGLSGKKVIEYTVIPRHAGTFEIPALEFGYFDVKAGQYKTLTSRPMNIEVEKGAGSDNASTGNVTNFAGGNQERLKVLGNDVRYIHEIKSLSDSDSSFFGSLGYWLFYIVPMALLLILAIIYRRQLKLNSDADLRRTRKASKVASRRLKDAALALRARNESDFYEAVHKAMFGYIGDKLSIKLSELSASNIKEQLAAHNVNPAVVEDYSEIISTCEFARYAPSSDIEAMDQLYKKATECLDNLESQIRK